MKRITPGEAAVASALLSQSIGLPLLSVVMMAVGSLLLSWSIDQVIGPPFEEQFERWIAEIEHDYSNVRSDKYRSNRNEN